MPEQNSFTNARLNDIVNEDIHTILGKVMSFRRQLTSRTEFKSQSGWDTPMNNFMVARLEDIAKYLQYCTVKVDTRSQSELETEAADNSISLAESYEKAKEVAFAHDNILGSVGVPIPVVYDLTGQDPNYPQPTEELIPNPEARNFIKKLDKMFVELTCLDSRHSPYGIEKYDSTKVREHYLSKLYAACQNFGGESNRQDVPTGVMASDLPDSFNANGEFDIKD